MDHQSISFFETGKCNDVFEKINKVPNKFSIAPIIQKFNNPLNINHGINNKIFIDLLEDSVILLPLLLLFNNSILSSNNSIAIIYA